MSMVMNAARRARDVGQRAVLRYRGWREPLQPRSELHNYWRQPDPVNAPEKYTSGEQRSDYLVQLLKEHTDLGPTSSIVELGCNVGRNLEHLRRAGWTDLTGVEINTEAVASLAREYPDLRATVVNAPIEDAVRGFEDGRFDLVFTMAVLEHLHTDSEWVFAEMARVAGRYVVTVEDEWDAGRRHVRRNYGRVFGALGLTETFTQECRNVSGLDLPKGFVARVFTV